MSTVLDIKQGCNHVVWFFSIVWCLRESLHLENYRVPFRRYDLHTKMELLNLSTQVVQSKIHRVNFSQIKENFTLKKTTFGPSLNRVKFTLISAYILLHMMIMYSVQCERKLRCHSFTVSRTEFILNGTDFYLFYSFYCAEKIYSIVSKSIF